MKPGSHKHRCATDGCDSYYICTQRDCRIDWQCPRCEDDEHFAYIERMNQHALNTQPNTQPNTDKDTTPS